MTSSNLIREKRGEFYYWEELDKGYSAVFKVAWLDFAS